MNVRFASLNKKYKQLFGALVLMLILGGIQPFLWQMVTNRVIDVQLKQSQEEQIVNVQERNQTMQQNLAAQESFLNQLTVVAPPIEARTQVVERLELLADKHTLPIEISLIQELPDGGRSAVSQIVPVVLSVSVQGSVDRLLTFMQEVEHVQELTVVESWSLNPHAGPPATSDPAAQPTPTPLPIYELRMDVLFFLRGATEEATNGQ